MTTVTFSAAGAHLGSLRQKILLHAATSDGIIADTAVYTHDGSPELPLANARVLMLRARDGLVQWAGYTSASGGYRATGLESGIDHVAVGIDRSGQYKAVAAGPVRASAAAGFAPAEIRVAAGAAYACELLLMNVAEPATVAYVSGLPSGLAYDGRRIISGTTNATAGSYSAQFDVTAAGAAAAIRITLAVRVA